MAAGDEGVEIACELGLGCGEWGFGWFLGGEGRGGG